MSVIARATQRIADAISAEVGGMFVGKHHPEGTQHVARLVAKALADDHREAVEAGDALADAVSDIMADDPESVLHTWVRRWHEAAHSGGQ